MAQPIAAAISTQGLKVRSPNTSDREANMARDKQRGKHDDSCGEKQQQYAEPARIRDGAHEAIDE